MWFLKSVLAIVVGYAAVIAVMYAAQTRMLFPTGMAAGELPLPPAAARLEVDTPDGERLHGVHIAPAQTHSDERLVVLGFGGNAWNAEALAVYLHELFSDVDVVAFHYRGYRPSTGRPSADALLADAPVVHDHVVATLNTGRVVAVGFSIGSGVAAHLASRRPLAGLILVSPFDSLEALARELYPWAPVRWLLRHHMSPAEDVSGLNTPIALIAAERDTIIPPQRTEALRQTIPSPVFDRMIADAGHNDLYGRLDFQTAMVEALQRIKLANSD